MTVYSVYLISKSGSLLYQKDFKTKNSPIKRQNSNDYLVIASTFHGIHAIASKITPEEAKQNYLKFLQPSSSSGINNTSVHNINSGSNIGIDGSELSRLKLRTHCNRSGLRLIETEQFKIFVDQTVSGLKIILFTSNDVSESRVIGIQDKMYELYADYVLKNPFYRLEMPVRIKLFDDKVSSAISVYNN